MEEFCQKLEDQMLQFASANYDFNDATAAPFVLEMFSQSTNLPKSAYTLLGALKYPDSNKKKQPVSS